jgi:hypothetical protein
MSGIKPGIKIMIMSIKRNQILDFDIYHGYHIPGYCILTMVFKKQLREPNIRLELLGLLWFFRETQWFFEVSEIPKTGNSLNLIFSKYPERVVL